VTSRCEIERLRSCAEYYRQEAAETQKHARVIYCRALAAHFEREAIELEGVIGNGVSPPAILPDDTSSKGAEGT
jgi:hypothetical protein